MMKLAPDQPLFYAPHLSGAGEVIELSDEESRHAGVAKRMREGDEIYLFDGCGGLGLGRILSAERRRPVRVRMLRQQFFPRPMPLLHLAAALPKGDRQSVMLDMATQLGMQRFTPLLTEFGATRPVEKSVERLRRIGLAACKQSRRLWLPEIQPASDLQQVMAQAANNEALVLVAHPGERTDEQIMPEKCAEIVFLVGPEGGFSAGEITLLAQSNGHFVDLGAGILRVETAAVAMLSRCQAVPGFDGYCKIGI